MGTPLSLVTGFHTGGGKLGFNEINSEAKSHSGDEYPQCHALLMH